MQGKVVVHSISPYAMCWTSNHIVVGGSDKKIVRHAELNISLYCLVRILCFQIMNECVTNFVEEIMQANYAEHSCDLSMNKKLSDYSG